MWIFGSFARGEERSDSDVDVLLEFEDEFTPTLLDVAGLAEDLRPAFGGRQIDLGRPGQLHWYVRDRVLREAKEIYAR